MMKLLITPMETGADGWTEVCLVSTPMVEVNGGYTTNEDGEASEGETLGHIRVVEGTEDGPHVWWDVRVIDDGRTHERRFLSLEGALLALGMRQYLPRDAQKLVGWSG